MTALDRLQQDGSALLERLDARRHDLDLSGPAGALGFLAYLDESAREYRAAESLVRDLAVAAWLTS